jgi:hypothetical protein
MSLQKSETRAREYRTRAEAATAAAEACLLEQPRLQNVAAATRWTEMAEAEERRSAELRLHAGEDAVG